MPIVVNLHCAHQEILGELRPRLHMSLSKAHPEGTLNLVSLCKDRVTLEDFLVAIL